MLVTWGAFLWVPVPGFDPGLYTPDGNVAIALDKLVLGRFQDGTSTSSGTKEGGGFEIARGVKVRVTNNIFQDINVEGMRHSRTISPPNRQPIIYVDSIEADTVFTESARDWVVRNNAYGWSPGFKTFFASIDTLKAPVFISPYGDSAFFRSKPNFKQVNNFEEYIQFADGPPSDSLLKYVQHRFKTNFDNKANPDPRADRNGYGELATAVSRSVN